MSGPRAMIDGRPVVPGEGETVLGAARRLGIDIPSLCHHERIGPEGGCRMCLVECEGEARLLAACNTALRPGMAVRTDSERLLRLRRSILSLIIGEHAEGRFVPSARGNEVEVLMERLGVEGSVFGHRAPGPETVDDSHPYMRFDRSLCIDCRRCLHACELIQGQFVYGIEGRGGARRLIFGPSSRFADSPCTACGACVDHCPTGAITDRDRIDSAPASGRVRTVCGFCGVGCRLEVETAAGRVLRIRGVPDASVNRGHLCVKGRYAHSWHWHRDRLTRPLLRDHAGDEFGEVGWEDAVAWLAGRIRKIRDEHGPDALGVVTSSRSTNEAAYLLQKLFRTAIGTNNVDCCARVCHSSTALALQAVTGAGAATACYEDIELARVIVVAGANPTEAHPVVGARIKAAALRGATLIVIDPRRTEIAEYALVHLQLEPGTNVAVFNALAKVIIESGDHDAEYLRTRCEGFEELRSFTSRLSIREQATISRVPVPRLEAAARAIAESHGALFVHGLGLSELTQGVDSVMAIANLAMLTGSIGRPGAGMLPLRGQNNVQGNADMGGMPDRITGYQPVSDPRVREHAARVWGKAPPADPGMTIPAMLEAARRGILKGLWVQGEDIAQSDPDQTRVLEALARLDLLVVQDPFLCETARLAHLVLPSASFLEVDGTFTNAERRVQRVVPAVNPPGEARPDWEVVTGIARALGQPWGYREPSDVMLEIARIAPASFGGMSYDRLAGDGLQWPCPEPGHPGTSRLHVSGFTRGKGRLSVVDHVPAPEKPDPDHPFLLITGRILEHYNVGTMTLRTPNVDLVPLDRVEVHPEDAMQIGLEEGDLALIESRWGSTAAPARITTRVAPGNVFLSFHHPGTHTNRLVGPHRDPSSSCPDYKVVAVSLRRAPAAS